MQANFTAPKDYQYTIGVVNPPEDTSSALSISSSSNYDDIYEGYNNRTYKARYGETIELSIRYQDVKISPFLFIFHYLVYIRKSLYYSAF